jgi:hypothetical protein
VKTLTPPRRWLVEHPGSADVRLEAGSSPDLAGEESLRADVVQAFPEYRLEVYFTERPRTLADADHIVLARHRGDDRLLGLIVARRRRGAVGRYLHVEMNLITSERRRRGLLVPLWRVMLARLVAEPDGLPDLVAMKTYNPMVYSSLAVVARLTGAGLYPAIGAVREPTGLEDVARHVAAEVAPRSPFDTATGVLKGAGVPRDFYRALPTTNKRHVQAHFAQHLEPGDRLLCLVRFGPGADLGRLLRRWNVLTDLATPLTDLATPRKEASEHA